jgi:DNA mismatch endonuclease (patch repair protein)
MAAIRSRNTGPEVVMRQALRRYGLVGYRCNPKGLPGKPDIAYTRWRVAVFVDGCFWHGHPDHFQFGKLSQYWDDKIRKTQQRDREQQAALENLGWSVLRFWDIDVKSDVDTCVRDVAVALRQAGRRGISVVPPRSRKDGPRAARPRT